MKHVFEHFFGSILIASVGSIAVGQQQPATMPVNTAPAVQASNYPRVEIFPFASISPAGQADWMGHGIQESLQSEVSRTGGSLVIPPHASAASDDAVAVAKQNNADIAVVGSVQTVGDDVRVNGHLINVSTGLTVGSFSTTGPQKNLFNIEDALGEQLRRLLPVSPEKQRMADAFNKAAVEMPNAAPVTVYQTTPLYSQPSVNNYYDNPPYIGTYYPDNYYGLGYYDAYPFAFYGGLEFYGGYYGGFGGHDHGRGYHDGYDGRGFHNYSHLTPNPGFRNPVYGGNRASPAFSGRGGGFSGGSAGHISAAGAGGGGFHGGGGGRR